jgi:succinoglycan biosynthesis transport protein ExoP
MNLSHFLAVVRARWVSAVIAFACVLTAAVMYLVFATRVYTATASLLIDVKPDPVSSMLYGGATPALINTQIEIIRSDRVAQRVVQNLKLADLADMRSVWAAAKSGLTIQEWLTEFVENGLDPRVITPGSNVINIGYHSADARFAATAANAYVKPILKRPSNCGSIRPSSTAASSPTSRRTPGMPLRKRRTSSLPSKKTRASSVRMTSSTWK